MNADTEVFTNPPIRRVVGHCSGVSTNNLNNLKPKARLGLCPKPHSLCEAAGQVANQPTYPYGECWVDSKASRVNARLRRP